MPRALFLAPLQAKAAIKDRELAMLLDKDSHELALRQFENAYDLQKEQTKAQIIQYLLSFDVGEQVKVEAVEVNAQVVEGKEVSAADRLIDLKRLLDAGAISQSEYDSKKGELLQSV